ncbi:MAG: hypothetical protein ACOC3F_00915, partial [Desulfosudaceae bacterium]
LGYDLSNQYGNNPILLILLEMNKKVKDKASGGRANAKWGGYGCRCLAGKAANRKRGAAGHSEKEVKLALQVSPFPAARFVPAQFQ